MHSIVLIGTGNVATHFFQAFGKRIVQIYGRNSEALLKFSKDVETTYDPLQIIDADMYIIAVSDSSIEGVSNFLGNKKGLVAHTSGSFPMNILQTKRRGVFYPLQTFTEGKKLDFSEIPICVEAEHEKDYTLLEDLGKSISNSVQRISSEKRKTLHLAAIFANNFSNHMFQISKEICTQNGVDFNLLKPLLVETVHKIGFLSPKEAMTGPARRNDVETMQRHLDSLEDATHKKIYQLISESIRKTYEKKL